MNFLLSHSLVRLGNCMTITITFESAKKIFMNAQVNMLIVFPCPRSRCCQIIMLSFFCHHDMKRHCHIAGFTSIETMSLVFDMCGESEKNVMKKFFMQFGLNFLLNTHAQTIMALWWDLTTRHGTIRSADVSHNTIWRKKDIKSDIYWVIYW